MLMQMVSSPQAVCSSQPQFRQPRSWPPAAVRALKESPSSSIELQISRLRRDAANAVAVLMEDDACKQEVGDAGRLVLGMMAWTAHVVDSVMLQ